MTRVYEADVQGPRTRALVIGVGAYPFAKPQHAGALGAPLNNVRDIGSAATSAALFTDWLIENGHQLSPSLASIDLLLNVQTAAGEICEYTWDGLGNPQGGVDPRGDSRAVEAPTTSNVKAAGAGWLAALGPDDHALLYMCGHGVVQGGDSIVFLSDLAQNPADPWDALVNVSHHARALKKHHVAAATLLIDACGEILATMSTVEFGNGAQFAYNNPLTPGSEKVSVLAAAPGGNKTYDGPTADATKTAGRFTQCLLEGLSGAAVDNETGAANGHWVVRPSDLLSTLSALYERRVEWPDRPFSPIPIFLPADAWPIVRFAQAPQVPVRFSFPAGHADDWALSVTDHQGASVVDRTVHPPEPWKVGLAASLHPYTLVGVCPAQAKSVQLPFNPLRGRIEQRVPV